MKTMKTTNFKYLKKNLIILQLPSGIKLKSLKKFNSTNIFNWS